MWSPVKATAARLLIERLMEPRRAQVRRAMLKILLDSGLDPRPSSDDVLAQVHDLCAKELAERVRLVAGELKKAYAADKDVAADILLDDLRVEVEQCINESMTDLIDDERLAAKLLGRLPRFLTSPHSTSL